MNCPNFNQPKFKSTFVVKRKQLEETMRFCVRDLFLITYSLGILLNISLNLLALREFCKPYIFS